MVRFRGVSKKCLVSLGALSSRRGSVIAPRTESCIAEMRAHWIRHIEGGLSLDVKSPGGKRNEGLSQIVEEERCEDLGVDEGGSERWIFRGKAIEIEETFEAFEGEFDLPTKSVDLKYILGGKCLVID